jgi:hypothetical protein
MRGVNSDKLRIHRKREEKEMATWEGCPEHNIKRKERDSQDEKEVTEKELQGKSELLDKKKMSHGEYCTKCVDVSS